MKIAIYHNLPSGGAKRALYEWTRRLSRSHSITIYTLSTADHAFCDLRPFADEHRVYTFQPRHLFPSPWGRLNHYQRWRDVGELVKIGFKIADDMDAGGYDVIFAHPCWYTFIPTFVQFAGTPVAYYLHEPFGARFERPIHRPYLASSRWKKTLERTDPLRRLFHLRVEKHRRRSIQHAALLLANSEFTRRQFHSCYGADAPVCPYGVNTADFQPLPDMRRESHLLSVGEMTPRKGFDFLIKSLSYLPSHRRPPLTLACNFVDERERTYLQRLAQDHSVELNIKTQLSTQALNREYNRAVLCVYAPVMEPFGLVPLEAMACGTPVVGVREGGVSESVVHGCTGLLTERDPTAFAAAMMTLLDDDDMRRRMGEAGRTYVQEQWSWDTSTERIENMLSMASNHRKGLCNRPPESLQSS